MPCHTKRDAYRIILNRTHALSCQMLVLSSEVVVAISGIKMMVLSSEVVVAMSDIQVLVLSSGVVVADIQVLVLSSEVVVVMSWIQMSTRSVTSYIAIQNTCHNHQAQVASLYLTAGRQVAKGEGGHMVGMLPSLWLPPKHVYLISNVDNRLEYLSLC